MKIAIVSNLFLPKWVGGTEVATLNTAQCLAAFGHDVHIVTSRDEGMPPESADGGVQLHRVYRPNLKSVGAGVFYLAVLNALSSISPQIIHVQDFLLGPCGFFAKRILKRPYIVWGRGYEFRDLRCRTATVLKDADAVIALTDDMRNELQKICPREIRGNFQWNRRRAVRTRLPRRRAAPARDRAGSKDRSLRWPVLSH